VSGASTSTPPPTGSHAPIDVRAEPTIAGDQRRRRFRAADQLRGVGEHLAHLVDQPRHDDPDQSGERRDEQEVGSADGERARQSPLEPLDRLRERVGEDDRRQEQRERSAHQPDRVEQPQGERQRRRPDRRRPPPSDLGDGVRAVATAASGRASGSRWSGCS
jgi:hypothetical protein